jgi:hypothetical protein
MGLIRVSSKRRRIESAATGNADVFVAAGFRLRLLELTLISPIGPRSPMFLLVAEYP